MARAPRAVGRPRPPLPVPASIGVDIGGTKVAAGVVDGHGQILERQLASTPSRSAQAVEDTITAVVRDLRSRHPAETVGIGAAGWVDTDQAVVRFSPHLAWRQEPLKERLEGRIDLPLIVDNDANAAAWAEYRYGAGQGASVMVCITLGTGIGGGLVLNGQLFRGSYGMAGEWGHMIVVPGGQLCECGNRGCWEQYASGNALVRDAKELITSGSPVVQGLVEAVGGVDAITGPAITEAAVAGEPLARELLADIGRWLGIGIANLAAALDPELIVVGGGVSAAGDLLLAPARESFRRTLTGRGFRPEARIELARFRNDAGLIGAADLARHSLIEPPGRVISGFWPRRRRRRAKRARDGEPRELLQPGAFRQAAAKRVQRRQD
jgi:glucokinase